MNLRRVWVVRRGVVVLLVMVVRRLGCGRRVQRRHKVRVQDLDVVRDALWEWNEDFVKFNFNTFTAYKSLVIK